MQALVMAAVIALLLAISALYVAAEFAMVGSRRSRLEQMAADGDRLAAWLAAVAADPRKVDAYVATCQVGITLSNLVIGFYGQARVAEAVRPSLIRLGVTEASVGTVSATAVLAVLTSLQVVIGELVPKNVGVRFPERLAVVTALPMRWSSALFRPFVLVFNGSGNLLLRAIGRSTGSEAVHVHRPEEIVLLSQESTAGGLLDPQEQRLLQNALRWRQMTVAQAMVHRTQLLAAPMRLSRSDMLALLAGSPHSRLLLHGGSIDDVVGTVHLKDLLCMGDRTRPAEVMRRPLYVPATAQAAEVFTALQRRRTPVAVVLDEYGGTAGMTTLDDLVEALFGDLDDEFDAQEAPIAVDRRGRRAIVRGDLSVRELNESLNLFLDATQAETIGGLVQARCGHVPREGEALRIDGVLVTVERMRGQAVARVALDVTDEQVAFWRGSVR